MPINLQRALNARITTAFTFHGDDVTIRARLMARFYDAGMEKLERKILQPRRSDLLAEVSGTVLEIGSGSGINLPFYRDVDRLILSEPDEFMRGRLTQRLRQVELDAEVLSCPAEQLPVDDRSVDIVVSTLVMCSVADPVQVLEEVRRVLKPGGTLLFLEHVKSPVEKTKKWQERINPMWSYMCGNCHLNRDTEKTMRDAGYDVQSESFQIRNAVSILQEWIVGRANLD